MRLAILLFAVLAYSNAGKVLNKDEFSSSVHHFSIKLLQQLNYKDDNILYSAPGLAMVAGMVMAGANNETRTQICNLLHINEYDDKVDKFHEQCRNLLNDYKNMHSKGRNATVEVANLVLTSDKLPISESFETTLKNQYDAAFGKENFEMTEQVKDKINKFVKERTHDVIPEILSKPLDANTVLALISTMYFKGFWQRRMREGLEKTFHNADKTETKMKMLTMDPKQLDYVDSQKNKYKILSLPYDGNVTMFIILPHEKDGLPKIIEEYNADEIIAVASEMKPTLVKVNLPKFEYDYQMDLNEVFPKMGFNLKTALAVIDSRLKVDQALHKAKIRTDTTGTEAAAGTVLSAVPYSAIVYNPPPIQFDVTHPFLYTIFDFESNTAVFTGVVNKLK